MRITLVIPEKMLSQARRACGAKTKTETVIRGLESLIQKKGREDLLTLRGRMRLRINLSKSRSR